jgi:molecular chaperone HtpG
MTELRPPSPAAEAGTFQVDFQSLIKVLGENLYANPKAAVRELIQNANDSCVRRQATGQVFRPAIQVTAQRDERMLVFEDNGSGMVHDDVVKYLASIGGGRTRHERARLSTENPKAAKMLIGQFGIGFLSAFVVAERVIVDTLSIEGGLPVCWVCEGTAEYQITQSDRAEPGTRVTLHLKDAHFDLLEEEMLQNTIVRYADFIAFPIYLNGNPNPVNRMNAPWHLEGTESEYAAYIKHRYGVTPLVLEIIAVERDDLEAQGALFIPPRSADWKRRLRSIDIFHKRMFIGEDLNILPEWAGFVSGVLDCPTLDLVASRESVISERPSYKALQDYLGEAVTAFIRRLAERERPIFLEVIRQHDWPVKWGAVRSDFFFDQVKDLIPVPSDMGPLTLPKYLERTPERLGGIKTIYYVPGEHPLGQQQSNLFRARGVPIFHADVVDEQFLKKYAERGESLSLRQMASGVVELMEFAEGAQWRALEARYQELGIVARSVRFHPPEMPAMAVRQADYDQERLIEQIVDGSRTLFDFMSRVGKEKSDAYGLCFNVDNPIIQRLAAYEGELAVLNVALRAIYSSALLAAGVELSPELSQSVAHSEMRVIELLLEQEARLQAEDKAVAYAPSAFDEPVAEELEPTSEPTDIPDMAVPLDFADEEEAHEGGSAGAKDIASAAMDIDEKPSVKESFLKRLIRRFRK